MGAGGAGLSSSLHHGSHWSLSSSQTQHSAAADVYLWMKIEEAREATISECIGMFSEGGRKYGGKVKGLSSNHFVAPAHTEEANSTLAPEDTKIEEARETMISEYLCLFSKRGEGA